MNHPAADQSADLVGGEIGAGQDRDDAVCGAGGAGVDVLDLGVGVGTAQEIGIGLAGAIDVVGVVALAGDEAEVLFAPDRGADDRGGHARAPFISTAAAWIALTM